MHRIAIVLGTWIDEKVKFILRYLDEKGEKY
jgi:hypothetical protein